MLELFTFCRWITTKLWNFLLNVCFFSVFFERQLSIKRTLFKHSVLSILLCPILLNQLLSSGVSFFFFVWIELNVVWSGLTRNELRLIVLIMTWSFFFVLISCLLLACCLSWSLSLSLQFFFVAHSLEQTVTSFFSFCLLVTLHYGSFCPFNHIKQLLLTDLLVLLFSPFPS